MRKFLSVLLTLLLFSALLVKAASAHTTKTDKPYGLILHIEPNEKPIANQISRIQLLFTNAPENFSPDKAQCITEIYLSKKNIYNQDICQNSPSQDDLHFDFRFPEIGVYKIKIAGKPKLQGDFEPFDFEYDVKVETVEKKNLLSGNPNAYLVILLLTGVLVISSLIILRYLKHGDKKQN